LKKLIAVFTTLALLGVILLPAAVAADGTGAGLDGATIMKKSAGVNLSELPEKVKGFMHGWQKPAAPAGFIGAPVKGNRYAVIIGISDYPGAGSVLEGGLDLFYADNDAYAIYQGLVGVYGFDPGNVTLLVDSAATRGAVLGTLAQLKKKVTKNDEVVFYFSGHSAVYTAAGRNPARVGDKAGLVVWADDGNDYTPAVVWDRELNKAFNTLKTNRLVIGLDCCYAQTFAEFGGLGRIVVMATDQDGISGEYGPAYADFGAVEIPELGWIEQGLFSFFFFTLGLTYGAADYYPADGVVTVEEAFYFAQGILTEWTNANPGLDEIPVISDRFYGDMEL